LFCNAQISNPRTVYVDVGFGFHVEFTTKEAIVFIDKRILYLQNQVLKHRSAVAMSIAEDVEKALELLQELEGAE
jgi:prefoldin subunit 5